MKKEIENLLKFPEQSAFLSCFNSFPSKFPSFLSKTLGNFTNIKLLKKGKFIEFLGEEFKLFCPSERDKILSYRHFREEQAFIEHMQILRSIRKDLFDRFLRHKHYEYSGIQAKDIKIDLTSSTYPIRKISHNQPEIEKSRPRSNALHFEKKQFVSYSGEIDYFTFKFCGKGEKYLQSSKMKLFEKGFFKADLQFGPGFRYKVENKQIEVTFGEFSEGQANGQVEVFKLEKSSNCLKLSFFEGVCAENKMESGKLTRITDSGREIEILVYEGSFDLRSEFNDEHCKLERKQYSFKNSEFQLESNYSYIGSVKHGKEEGRGKASLTSNSLPYSYDYKGTFQNGVFEGEGEIVFSGDYNLKSYKGNFSKGEWLFGYGVASFLSGDVYEGFFGEGGRKNMVGMYSHFDQRSRKVVDYFFGQFYLDTKVGIGVYRDSQGKLLIGNYFAGNKEGIFELIDLNSKREDSSTERDSYSNSSKEALKTKRFFYFNEDDLIEEEKNHGGI